MTETYQGHANRETWAFNVHWQNDQPLYVFTLMLGSAYLREHPDASDRELGEHVVNYWQDRAYDGPPAPTPALVMMAREVGSWWRVDPAEVGEAVRESISVEA